MPRVSVWFVRASLVYLLAGFTIGALALASKGVMLGAWVWELLPAHVEFLLGGWVMLLVMGVAYWIFPRFGMTPAARGREDLAWLAFALANTGVLVSGLGRFAGLPAGATLLGRVAEALAAALLAASIWARVRGSGLSPM